MSSLRTSLNDLTSRFADSVLAAFRGASLRELLADSDDGGRRGPGRPPTSKGAPATPETSRARKSGRLARRSPEDIANALDEVVGLLRENNGGLRAEQIRKELKMLPKEMPRVLKEGLAKRKLKSKGQRRATTYTAA